jgi:hypothetical protein
VPSADFVGGEHQLERRIEPLTIEGDWKSLREFNRDFLGFDPHVLLPERDAHDRVHDHHVLVEVLEVFRLVRRAQHIRVRAVRLLGLHPVREVQ